MSSYFISIFYFYIFYECMNLKEWLKVDCCKGILATSSHFISIVCICIASIKIVLSKLRATNKLNSIEYKVGGVEIVHLKVEIELWRGETS